MQPIFANLPFSRVWWGGLILLCLALETVALYYQYQLQYLPCVLCIHVRMLLALLLLVAILAFLLQSSRAFVLLAFGMTTAIWLWMTERSYMLLATEGGWIIGECQMQSGLPEWLAVEQWLPWIFKIHEPCGYTPFLIGRISMAQVLIVMSAVFGIICITALTLMFRKKLD